MYFRAVWMVLHCVFCHLCVFPCAGSDPESHGCGFIHSGASQAVATMKQIGQEDESAPSALIIVFGYFYLGHPAMWNEPVLNFLSRHLLRS